MSKLKPVIFTVAFDDPTGKDLAGTMLYFGATPEEINYDSLAKVFVAAPANQFKFPDDAPDLVLPEVTNDLLYIKAAAIDQAGNLGDLSGPLTVPFDQIPPGPVTNLRLV